MDQQNTGQSTRTWNSSKALGLAVFCLLLGILMGYLIRGSKTPRRTVAQSNSGPVQPAQSTPQISPDQMKHMADQQAEPLLRQLSSDPRNIDVLVKVATVYFSAHQFPESMKYLQTALDVKPDQPALRMQLGRMYYYTGDADKALTEFNKVIEAHPNDADALFNIGMVKWQAKKDAKGAIASWKRLLATNPNHPKRQEVEQWIATVQQQASAGASAGQTD